MMRVVRMLTRLRSEYGLALPLALAIMLVLSIAVFAMIEFSSANTRNSSVNERRQSAKALAEAGVAHGASFLAQQGQSYTAATGVRTVAIQGVTVEWSATYAAPHWTVSATAAPRNPTGPGTSGVSRTVQAKFFWRPITSPPLWHGLYVGNPGSRLFMSNSTSSIATDVYARGNVTMTQGKFLGSSFQVRGTLTLDSSAMYDTSIGASERVNCSSDYKSFKSDFPAPCSRPTPHRVTDFRVRDGCRFNTGDTPTASNCALTSVNGGTSGKIWLTCPNPSACPPASTPAASPAFSATPDDIVLAAPDVPPTTWDLGPGKPCVNATNAPSFTTGGVDIMRSSSYSCVSPDGQGELSWNHSTNTLTARGVIYFEGHVTLESGRWGLVAPGEGRIYVRDKLLLKNNTGLCGLRGATAPNCDASWDPLNGGNLVEFIVGSDDPDAILQDNFHLQGGLYTDNGSYLVQGNSTFKGPTTFEGGVEIKNFGAIDAWSPSTSSPPSGGPVELVLVRGSWRG